ncbi:MAG TPA: STAS-like domain-containing protein [Bdellovibrionota bacterium]|nr:STAS-like domain-containing protein [Bdellovibrionota bacterium]
MRGHYNCSFTGVEFREQFLQDLESSEWWSDPKKTLVLDFAGVTRLGPSWANEVFAYYTKDNRKPDEILQKIQLKNISPVKLETIQVELKNGYRRGKE